MVRYTLATNDKERTLKTYYIDVEFLAPLDMWSSRTGTIPIEAENEEAAKTKLLSQMKTVRDAKILGISETPPAYFHDSEAEQLPDDTNNEPKKLH